jgi:alcohol dehydrogenase YqhD (iron-dependent ADH family)
MKSFNKIEIKKLLGELNDEHMDKIYEMIKLIYDYVKDKSDEEIDQNIEKDKSFLLEILEFKIGIPFVKIGPTIDLMPFFKRIIKNRSEEKKAQLIFDELLKEKRRI